MFPAIYLTSYVVFTHYRVEDLHTLIAGLDRQPLDNENIDDLIRYFFTVSRNIPVVSFYGLCGGYAKWV